MPVGLAIACSALLLWFTAMMTMKGFCSGMNDLRYRRITAKITAASVIVGVLGLLHFIWSNVS